MWNIGSSEVVGRSGATATNVPAIVLGSEVIVVITGKGLVASFAGHVVTYVRDERTAVDAFDEDELDIIELVVMKLVVELVE